MFPAITNGPFSERLSCSPVYLSAPSHSLRLCRCCHGFFIAVRCLRPRRRGSRGRRFSHAHTSRSQHHHRCLQCDLKYRLLTLLLSAPVQLYSPNGSVFVHPSGVPSVSSHRVIVYAPAPSHEMNVDASLPPPLSSSVGPDQSILLGGGWQPSGMQSRLFRLHWTCTLPSVSRFLTLR